MSVIPNINYTLHHDICTGCGVCEAACPKSAIKTIVKEGRFLPEIDAEKCNNIKGCHRCYDSCPGVGVNIIDIAKEAFTGTGIHEDKMAGRYLQCFSGYSNDYDIRYHSASGGMISQFLIWLLDNNIIDGAVVTRFDKEDPLLVKSYIATSKEEIIAARSSKYSPVSLHKAIKDLNTASGSRYVVVGLPCHIQGLRKLMTIDRKLKDKIVGLFSIYCSCGRSFYLTEHVLKERGIQKSSLTYLQFRDEGCLGKMVVKCPVSSGGAIKAINEYSETSVEEENYVYKEHYQSYYHSLRSFFIPRRCLYCIDHYGELGDISFGDIHIKPYSDDKIGVNSLIVRNQYWLDLLIKCHQKGVVTINEIPFRIISESQPMSFKKKGRNGAFLNIGKRMGWVVPKYDVDYFRAPNLHDWLDYVQNRIQQFIGRNKFFWPIISLLKSKVNIH